MTKNESKYEPKIEPLRTKRDNQTRTQIRNRHEPNTTRTHTLREPKHAPNTNLEPKHDSGRN